MEKNLFPKMEVLPHPIEVGLDLVARAFQFARSIVVNTNVPLSASNHYTREHFTDEPVQPPQGLPPAEPWPVIERPDAAQLCKTRVQ